MGKNCALGLEYGPRPKAEGRTQDLGHSFFPIRTSRPVNNIYILNARVEFVGQVSWNEKIIGWVCLFSSFVSGNHSKLVLESLYNETKVT